MQKINQEDKIPMKDSSHLFVVVFLLICFCAFMKIPTIVFPHTEPDELIYWQLTENFVNYGHYNLKGTEILPSLSPYMYDRELFHYPPLFSILLSPFVFLGLRSYSIVVSWIGHFLCILSVAFIGRHVFYSDGKPNLSKSFLFLIPLLGVAVDPFLTFVSRKLWLDSIMAGLTSLSAVLFYIACKEKKPMKSFILAGFILGLAGLVKPTALIITPVITYLLFSSYGTKNEKLKVFFYGLSPVFLLLLPWFIVFYKTFGVLFPYWVKPDSWLLEHYPFVRQAVERPIYYYLKKLILIQPVVLLLLVELIRRKFSLFKESIFNFSFLWFGIFIMVISYIGTTGVGFQTRHIEPLYPSIYIMLYSFLRRKEEKRYSLFVLLAALCILYAGITGGIYLLAPGYDEISSILELTGLIK